MAVLSPVLPHWLKPLVTPLDVMIQWQQYYDDCWTIVVSSKRLKFFLFKKWSSTRSFLIAIQCQYWSSSTNISIIKRNNECYCQKIREKSNSARADMCTGLQIFLLDVSYLTQLIQRLAQQTTKLHIATVTLLFYLVLI